MSYCFHATGTPHFVFILRIGIEGECANSEHQSDCACKDTAAIIINLAVHLTICLHQSNKNRHQLRSGPNHHVYRVGFTTNLFPGRQPRINGSGWPVTLQFLELSIHQSLAVNCEMPTARRCHIKDSSPTAPVNINRLSIIQARTICLDLFKPSYLRFKEFLFFISTTLLVEF